MIAEAQQRGAPVDADGLRASARVYAAYQRTLRDANAADFGDLLLWPARAMQVNASLSRSAGPAVSTRCLRTSTRTSIMRSTSGFACSRAEHAGSSWSATMTRASTAWRGSDLAYIRRFTRDFPGAAQVKLEENFRSTGHILDAANAVIAQDRARLGKTLFTCKPDGDRIEVVGFRNAEAEAAGIVGEMQRRHAEGIGWDEMAVLYRSNALSRGFEEALMRARIPYVLVGDVGFYQRAEIKDVLALLRLAATPDDTQSDEALRRVINMPGARLRRQGDGDPRRPKPAWRQVSLLVALETADLPPKTRSAGLAFVDAMRGVGRDRAATLADQISLLLDATGYRAMLRESRAETTEGRLENVQELIQLAGSFHTARELLDHAALSTGGPHEDADRAGAADDAAQGQGAGVRPRLPAGLGGGKFPARLWRPRRGAAARLRGDHPRHASASPSRIASTAAATRSPSLLPRRHSRAASGRRLVARARRIGLPRSAWARRLSHAAGLRAAAAQRPLARDMPLARPPPQGCVALRAPVPGTQGPIAHARWCRQRWDARARPCPAGREAAPGRDRKIMRAGGDHGYAAR